ncbi:unnamed protein product, partial [Ectocarpus fasciculatus]
IGQRLFRARAAAALAGHALLLLRGNPRRRGRHNRRDEHRQRQHQRRRGRRAIRRGDRERLVAVFRPKSRRRSAVLDGNRRRHRRRVYSSGAERGWGRRPRRCE